jgi:hypothetical protein
MRSRLSLIHPSAWKVNSQKFECGGESGPPYSSNPTLIRQP